MKQTTYPPCLRLALNPGTKRRPITICGLNLVNRQQGFPGKSLLSLILRLVSSSKKPSTYNISIINMAYIYAIFHSAEEETAKGKSSGFRSSLNESWQRNNPAGCFRSCFIFSFLFFGRHSKLSVREWFGLPKTLCPDPRPETFKSLPKNICLPKTPYSLWAVNIKGG